MQLAQAIVNRHNRELHQSFAARQDLTDAEIESEIARLQGKSRESRVIADQWVRERNEIERLNKVDGN